MSAKFRIAIVMLSAGIAFYAIVGGFPWDRGATAKGNQWAQLRIFDEVLYRIVKDYVDEPDMERVRTGALRGLAEGLDPYSAYLTPMQVAEYKPVGPGMHEVGGMALSKYSGYLYVVAVAKNTPAERAGIVTGDIIEYIDKAPTRDISLYDAEMLLTATTTPVDLKIFRSGRSGKIQYTTGPEAIPAVDARMMEPGIGYVHVPTLAAGKAAEVKSAVEQLASKGANKIVLDLRGCATGSFEEGAAVADLFIDSGVLGRKIGRGGSDATVLQAKAETTVFKGQISAIIDFSTAGAGEVVASAILANKRGEVVGEKSFGAGVEVDLFRLRDGGAMLLTVAKFAPAEGKAFLEEPVTPTLAVEQPKPEISVPDDDDDAQPDDEQNQADQKPLPKPGAVDDLQLKKAVDVLRGGAASAAKAA